MIDFLKDLDSATLSAVLSSGISVVGAIISALIAWLVSRSSAKTEIEKIKVSWKREDIVSSEKEFAEMAEAVGRCLQNRHYTMLADASGKVNAVRAKESGELGEALDKLHQSLLRENINGPDIKNINACLDEVIEKKRKAQSNQKTED